MEDVQAVRDLSQVEEWLLQSAPGQLQAAEEKAETSWQRDQIARPDVQKIVREHSISAIDSSLSRPHAQQSGCEESPAHGRRELGDPAAKHNCRHGSQRKKLKLHQAVDPDPRIENRALVQKPG